MILLEALGTHDEIRFSQVTFYQLIENTYVVVVVVIVLTSLVVHLSIL